MGSVLQEQGKLDEAIEAYKKAISLKPDFAEAFYNVGGALHVQGKFEEAIEAYKKAISIKPEVLPEPNDDFPLKLGSKGERVYQLRVYLLKNHGAAKGLITDEFDAVTEERVLRLYKVKEVSEQLFNERNMGNIKKQHKDGRKTKH